jgi:hypothetical protein
VENGNGSPSAKSVAKLSGKSGRPAPNMIQGSRFVVWQAPNLSDELTDPCCLSTNCLLNDIRFWGQDWMTPFDVFYVPDPLVLVTDYATNLLFPIITSRFGNCLVPYLVSAAPVM